jgi:hypothetical protein
LKNTYPVLAFKPEHVLSPLAGNFFIDVAAEDRYEPTIKVSSLEEATQLAEEASSKGDTILIRDGFKFFKWYKNGKDFTPKFELLDQSDNIVDKSTDFSINFYGLEITLEESLFSTINANRITVTDEFGALFTVRNHIDKSFNPFHCKSGDKVFIPDFSDSQLRFGENVVTIKTGTVLQYGEIIIETFEGKLFTVPVSSFYSHKVSYFSADVSHLSASTTYCRGLITALNVAKHVETYVPDVTVIIEDYKNNLVYVNGLFKGFIVKENPGGFHVW